MGNFDVLENILKICKIACKFANMAKLKPLPMPIDLVLNHRAMFFCTNQTYKAVLAVTTAFWQSGCPASGLDDVSIATLAKLGPGRWMTVKTDLKAILSELLPELARQHAILESKRERIREAVREAGAKGRATQRLRKLQILTATEKKPALVTPQKAERYTNSRAVMSPQKLAAVSKLAVNPDARFRDK
jgi:hypothetical protein